MSKITQIFDEFVDENKILDQMKCEAYSKFKEKISEEIDGILKSINIKNDLNNSLYSVKNYKIKIHSLGHDQVELITVNVTLKWEEQWDKETKLMFKYSPEDSPQFWMPSSHKIVNNDISIISRYITNLLNK